VISVECAEPKAPTYPHTDEADRIHRLRRQRARGEGADDDCRGFTGGGAGQALSMSAGKQSHSCSNDEMINQHRGNLVRKNAPQIDGRNAVQRRCSVAQ